MQHPHDPQNNGILEVNDHVAPCWNAVDPRQQFGVRAMDRTLKHHGSIPQISEEVYGLHL